MEAVKGPDGSTLDAAACWAEDADARLTRLVNTYQHSLRRLCCVILKDGALAEDAVQETFLKAYRALPAFRGGCSEKSWLTRIAVNVCRDMSRSWWARHVDSRVALDTLPEPAAPMAAEGNQLWEAVLALPTRQREAVMCYFYQEMTMAEAAEALHTSVSTISRRLEAAKRTLARQLKGGDTP